MNLNFGGRGPQAAAFDLGGKESRDMTPEEIRANLEKHNCPEHLIKRAVERAEKRATKFGYTRRQPVAAAVVQPHKLEERVAQMVVLLRKMERAVGKALSHTEAKALLRAHTSATKDDSGIHSYDSLRQHMQTCSDLTECSYAIATTVNDLLDSWPGSNDGDLEENDSLRSMSKGDRKRHKEFHDMHKACHRMLGEACENIARARLTVNQIVD